jgi:hypothetical protein
MKNGHKGDEITASKLRGIIPLFNKDTVLRGAKTFSITNKMRLPLPSLLAVAHNTELLCLVSWPRLRTFHDKSVLKNWPLQK